MLTSVLNSRSNEGKTQLNGFIRFDEMIDDQNVLAVIVCREFRGEHEVVAGL